MPIYATPEVTEWAAYWYSLPKDGLLPLRSALNPADIKPLLPNLMVFDLSDPAIVRFRLAGTAIAERYGFDPTGSDFLDLLDPETREVNRQLLQAAVRHPFGMLAILTTRHGSGLLASVETLSFPFADRKSGVPQMATVSVRLADTQRLDTKADSLHQVKATDFTFIDLGAGLPEMLKDFTGKN